MKRRWKNEKTELTGKSSCLSLLMSVTSPYSNYSGFKQSKLIFVKQCRAILKDKGMRPV